MFSLTVLSVAFTRIAKLALGTVNRDVVSWLDDILIWTSAGGQYMTTLNSVFTKLLTANSSVKFPRCIYPVSHYVFLDMIADSTGVRL